MLLRHGPLTRLLPDNPRPTHGSLGHDVLCGVDEDGDGEYTTAGITALCEGIMGSSVSSLKCAAAPSVRLSVMAR